MKVKDSYLLKRPKTSSSVYQSIIKESVNWKYLSFEARKLEFKKEFEWNTDENEMVIVLLSGNYKFESDKGSLVAVYNVLQIINKLGVISFLLTLSSRKSALLCSDLL